MTNTRHSALVSKLTCVTVWSVVIAHARESLKTVTLICQKALRNRVFAPVQTRASPARFLAPPRRGHGDAADGEWARPFSYGIFRSNGAPASLPPRVLLPHKCTQDGWFLQPKRRPARLPRWTIFSRCICRCSRMRARLPLHILLLHTQWSFPMSAHLSRLRLFQRHLRSLVWVWVWVGICDFVTL